MIDNDKFIYQEVTEARRGQQLDIEHLNNKTNWILTTSAVVIGLLINTNPEPHPGYFFGFIFILLSFFYSLKSLLSKRYYHGPALSELHKHREDSTLGALIGSTNKKIISDIEKNKKIIWVLEHNLKISIICLFIGLVIIVLMSLNFWEFLCQIFRGF